MTTFPQAGDVFVERYRLEQVLGEGSFARVFSAADLELGRKVAIKILKPDDSLVDAERAARRFSQEMQLVASIHDQHVVQLFDYGRTEDGLMYMVLELVPGRDLEELLAEGPIPEETALRIMTQVLSALRAAHEVGTLHRDVKPENIRVYEYMGDSRAKLLDFGIAKSQLDDAGLTATGMAVGTPRFMAPEQLFGEPLGPTTDLYALALLTYEMLTGGPLNHMRKIANDQHVGIEPHPRIREPLRHVLNRMLEKDVSNRYPNADAVTAALEQITTIETRAGQHGSAPADISDEAATIEQPKRQRRPVPTTQREYPEPQRDPNDDARRRDLRRLVFLSLFAVFAGATVGIVMLMLSGRSSSTDDEPAAATSQRELTLPLRQASRPPPPPQAETNQAGRPEPSNEDTGGPVPDGCGQRPPSIGSSNYDTTQGLRHVDWRVHVPKNYDKDVRHTVVLLFHDDTSSPTDIIARTRLDRLADEKNFVIIAPRDPDLAYVWTDAHLDDAKLAFEHTATRLCLDRDHVFAVGHGSGGEAANRLTCTDWVHGFVMASYIIDHPSHHCSPHRPAPVLYFAPMNTPFQPPEGGKACGGGQRISYDQFEEMWQQRNNCSGQPAMIREYEGGVCRHWDCPTPFVSCRHDGGRRWPGAPPRSTDILECDGPPHDFPHNEVLWEFLSALE